MKPPDEELQNDPQNACVGCGPGNSRGLNLRFRRAGDGVEADFRAEPWMEGWPGRLHSGLLYLAMLEAANWCVYGQRGRIGLPVRTGALTTRRWIATGTALRLSARVVGETGGRVAVEVLARDESGAQLASLERDFVLPTEREFLERMGYDEVPEVFRGLLG